MILKSLLSLGLLLIALLGKSQNDALQWHIGPGLVIDFSTDPPSTSSGPNNTAINGQGGTAAICNDQGQLLFYSNGTNVWNQNNEIMPGLANWPPTALGFPALGGGLAPSHGALIVPIPDNPNQYYLFSAAEQAGQQGQSFVLGISGISYVIIDMSENNGLGDVVTPVEVIMNTTSEKLAVTKHCNGKDYWVVGHDYASNNFYSWQITADGIQPPITSSIGYVHDCALGQMKISPDGKKLACATLGFQSPTQNTTFEVFSFDNSTGQITESIFLDNDFPEPFFTPGQGVYGVAFSPDSQIAYALWTGVYTGFSSILYQYQIAENITNPLSSKTIIAELQTNAAAMQLGPDCRIYIPYLSDSFIAVIENPNNIGTSCNFNPQGLSIAAPSPIFGYSVPTINESALFLACNEVESPGEVFINYSDTCLGEPTSFNILADFSIEEVIWDFGENNAMAIGENVQHTFSAPGTYTVTASYRVDCISYEEQQQVRIIGTVPLLTNFLLESPVCIDSTNAAIELLSTSTSTGTFIIPQIFTLDTINNILLLNQAPVGNYPIIYTASEELCNKTFSTEKFLSIIDCELEELLEVCDVYIPNAITANNDGKNDAFRPIMLCSPLKYSLSIYNQWGDKIFQTFDENEPWIGNLSQTYVQDGIYFYLVNIDFGSGKTFSKQGHITVLR